MVGCEFVKPTNFTLYIITGCNSFYIPDDAFEDNVGTNCELHLSPVQHSILHCSTVHSLLTFRAPPIIPHASRLSVTRGISD